MDMDYDSFIATLKAGLTVEDYNPETGLHTAWRYDPLTDRGVATVTSLNHKQILSENSKMLEQNNNSWKGDIHRVGRIPALAAYNYCQQRGMTMEQFLKDPKETKRLINDADNKAFRIKEGRI